MRVVSQNKRWSVDFNNTVFWTQDNMIYAKIDGDSIVFGEYESHEHAQEIFLDLHNAYAPVGIASTNLTEEQCQQFIGSKNVCMKIIQMDNPNWIITTYDNYVYYMPKQ